MVSPWARSMYMWIHMYMCICLRISQSSCSWDNLHPIEEKSWKLINFIQSNVSSDRGSPRLKRGEWQTHWRSQTGLQKEEILDLTLKGRVGLSRGHFRQREQHVQRHWGHRTEAWNCTVRTLQEGWCGWSIRNEVAGMESETGEAAWDAPYLMGKSLKS